MLRPLLAWVDRVARFLEKRPHEFIRVGAFVGFVSLTRILLELLLGGFEVTAPLALLSINFAFYFTTFYAFAVALKVALPGIPWQKSSNAILIGLFLGIFPPLIDAFVFGLGNKHHYAFMADFPNYPVFFWDPERHLNFGEATAIWLSIAFCGLYVYVRSRRLVSAGLALALAYVVVLWGGSWGATVVRHWLISPLNATLQVPFTEGSLLALVQVLQIFIAYLVLQPFLAKGLFRRLPHTLPFVATVFLGAAFEGKIGPVTWLYALLVLYASLVALAQNDFFDPLEGEGSIRYVGRQDVALLNGLTLIVAAIFLGRNSAATYLLLLQFVASVVYNYPFYRARDYFPANLKIEGLWGATSFLIGWLSARESLPPSAVKTTVAEGAALSALDADSAIAAFLIFGGFSLLSALKDQKDIELDTRSKTQTLYTFAARKNRVTATHRMLIAIAAVAFLVGPVLLALKGMISWPWVGVGLVAAICLAALNPKPSRTGFYRALMVISAYLFALGYALAWA